TLASSSPQGTFATDPSGPWTATLVVTVPAGSATAPAVYYRDTKAGAATLTATAGGRVSGSQTATVTAAPLAALSLSPASATVFNHAAQTFTAIGADAYGNAVGVTPAWS